MAGDFSLGTRPTLTILGTPEACVHSIIVVVDLVLQLPSPPPAQGLQRYSILRTEDETVPKLTISVFAWTIVTPLL